MMSNPYYTLFVNRRDGLGWIPEFGDYDHATVIAEKDDMLDDDPDLSEMLTSIERTRPDQRSIEKAKELLNQRTPFRF